MRIAPDPDTHFVVGGDAALGKALVERCAATDVSVLRTTRRPIRTENESLYLDLGADIDDWEPPAGIRVAYLLAAVTSQAECLANPGHSFRVNVENTLLMAKRLIASGSHVVFTSTNLVFDGSRPAPQPYDQINPIGVYGKQKSVVERELLKLGNATTILRLSKVVQPGMELLSNWLRDFNARKPISPFSDAVISPVPVALAADALFRLGEGKHSGIYQLSAASDVSYADIAYRLATYFGADPALVRPTTTREAGWKGEPFPAHTTLDCRSLTETVGIEAPNPWVAIDGQRT